MALDFPLRLESLADQPSQDSALICIEHRVLITLDYWSAMRNMFRVNTPEYARILEQQTEIFGDAMEMWFQELRHTKIIAIGDMYFNPMAVVEEAGYGLTVAVTRSMITTVAHRQVGDDYELHLLWNSKLNEGV